MSVPLACIGLALKLVLRQEKSDQERKFTKKIQLQLIDWTTDFWPIEWFVMIKQNLF
jgi:hypothetical protein